MRFVGSPSKWLIDKLKLKDPLRFVAAPADDLRFRDVTTTLASGA